MFIITIKDTGNQGDLMFNLKPLTLETVLQMLIVDYQFTLSRHKDGEFYAIMGTDRSHNCDKHTYFHDMGETLLWTLIDNQDEHENRLYGMQPMVHRKMHEPVSELFRVNRIKIDWFESDLFHHALRDGKLYPFLKALEGRDVTIVGPARIRPISEFVNYNHFVEIPQMNCWLDSERIEDDILKAGGDIVLFSSSMPTAVMIHNLYPEIGITTTMIDFGSIWEALLGIKLRSYQKAMSAEAIQRNFHE